MVPNSIAKQIIRLCGVLIATTFRARGGHRGVTICPRGRLYTVVGARKRVPMRGLSARNWLAREFIFERSRLAMRTCVHAISILSLAVFSFSSAASKLRAEPQDRQV